MTLVADRLGAAERAVKAQQRFSAMNRLRQQKTWCYRGSCCIADSSGRIAEVCLLDH